MANDVRDNPAKNRFELVVDGHTAFVEYSQSPSGLALLHTEVPKELGGRGIGSIIARGVLDLVRSRDMKVELQCDFLRGYVEKHPEYSSLVAAH